MLVSILDIETSICMSCYKAASKSGVLPDDTTYTTPEGKQSVLTLESLDKVIKDIRAEFTSDYYKGIPIMRDTYLSKSQDYVAGNCLICGKTYVDFENVEKVSSGYAHEDCFRNATLIFNKGSNSKADKEDTDILKRKLKLQD